jgi:hypothetical protein
VVGTRLATRTAREHEIAVAAGLSNAEIRGRARPLEATVKRCRPLLLASLRRRDAC